MSVLSCEQELTDSNDTSFSSVFDESLPQSSSESLASSYCETIHKDEKPEELHIRQFQLDRNDYETAASQRPRRDCKRQAPAAYTAPPPLPKKVKVSRNSVAPQLDLKKTARRPKTTHERTPSGAASRRSTQSDTYESQVTLEVFRKITAKRSARSEFQAKEKITPRRVGRGNTQLETPDSLVKTNRANRSSIQQETREDPQSPQETCKTLVEATPTRIIRSKVPSGLQLDASITEHANHGQQTPIATEKTSITTTFTSNFSSISTNNTKPSMSFSQQEGRYGGGVGQPSPLLFQASQLNPLMSCDPPSLNVSFKSNAGSHPQFQNEQCAQLLSFSMPLLSQDETIPNSSQSAADLNTPHEGIPPSPQSQDGSWSGGNSFNSQEGLDQGAPGWADGQSITSQDCPQTVYPLSADSQKNHIKPSCILPQSSPSSFAHPATDSATHHLPGPVDDRKAIDVVPSQDSYQTQPTQPLTHPISFYRSRTSEETPSPPDIVHPLVDKPDVISDVESQATTVDEGENIMTAIESTRVVEQQQLYHISKKLFAHRQSGLSRPEPVGQPEVWADGRQELCETLHYFRSYQSACYSTGGSVRAFMFDKVAHPRDYIDSNVVIARAGGGLVRDKNSGEMKTGRDQVEDTVVQGLRNCMNHYNPVVIITGVDNPYIPSQPPHQYCVLDYFKPTHIWMEKSGKSKILRYRFEKLNMKKESWWRAKGVPDPVELGLLSPPISKICEVCDVASQQVYLNGWMCLQPACIKFWKIITSDHDSMSYEPDEAHLLYDPRFLKQQTSWPNDNHDYPLTSNDVELSGHSIPGEDTSQAFWLGMVCPLCGRCNSRLAWTGWECLNPACNFTKRPPHTLISALSLREPLWPLTSSYTLSRDIHLPSIEARVTFAHGYRIVWYTIPGISGFITHMIANKTINEEPGGPDAMFEDLQNEDIGLRRRALSNSQLKGESYCRHFAVNYGMPYKFIAATASHPFSSATRSITATRSRLNWAAKYLFTQETNTTMEAVSEQWAATEFNKVLALGYFEAQKINYHDDGEFGLGPTIATLSLGAPGTMRIRMKARHYNGVSAAGVYDDTPLLPTCAQYEARLTLQPSLNALKKNDMKAYRARLKQIPRELKLKSGGNAKDALKMELGHGDVVVMHGAALQRYYEHAVEHQGKLRFALTCRFIDPESLGEGERPVEEVERDEGGYDGERIV